MRLVWFPLALSLCACEAAATESVLERVIRGKGIAEPAITLPRGSASARVCAGPDLPAAEQIGEPVALYPARGVLSVTLDLPFVAAPRDGRTHCDLVIQGRPISPGDGTGARFDYASCALLITDGSPQRVIIAPLSNRATGEDRFVLSECVYRLAMYVQGYKGALAEPSNAIFLPRERSASHVGKPWVGPSATGIPAGIALRCPHLVSLYYGSDLAASLERSCPAYDEMFRDH